MRLYHFIRILDWISLFILQDCFSTAHLAI